jgi:hypothetical protein
MSGDKGAGYENEEQFECGRWTDSTWTDSRVRVWLGRHACAVQPVVNTAVEMIYKIGATNVTLAWQKVAKVSSAVSSVVRVCLHFKIRWRYFGNILKAGSTIKVDY